MIYNQYLFKNLSFDPDKLAAIINLFHLIQVLVINSDLNAKTVDGLIAVSKQKPSTLSYLTASVPMVAYMDSLKNEKGADWVRVPFKGGGEATNAILGGSTPSRLTQPPARSRSTGPARRSSRRGRRALHKCATTDRPSRARVPSRTTHSDSRMRGCKSCSGCARVRR